MKKSFDFFISSRWRNKENVLELTRKLRAKGYSVYCFLEEKGNPGTIEDNPEEVMSKFEKRKSWQNDPLVKDIFKRDLVALKNSKCVIVLLPGGKSTHIEAGIAYGLGKKLVLVGTQTKTETLYLVFDEIYNSIEEMIRNLK